MAGRRMIGLGAVTTMVGNCVWASALPVKEMAPIPTAAPQNFRIRKHLSINVMLLHYIRWNACQRKCYNVTNAKIRLRAAGHIADASPGTAAWRPPVRDAGVTVTRARLHGEVRALRISVREYHRAYFFMPACAA